MIPLPVSSESVLGDVSFRSLKAHVIETTGLAYYEDKDADLARRIERRLYNLSVRDCAAYLECLRDPVRGPAELDELISEITIGETYFFRHREHFDALRDIVIPDLMARNRLRCSLRVWSAGCADGPEPYSLAILLEREMSPELTGWDVSIVGTDINRRCLARACEGKFEEWALRSTADSVRRECFVNAGKLWTLNPRYRRRVSFQYHNLVEHHSPPLVNDSMFDLIICRNVLIYFDAESMRQIITRFHTCLAPGAWLLVGPTEPNMTSFKSFQVVNASGVTLYQKPADFVPAAETPVFRTADIAIPAAAVAQAVTQPTYEKSADLLGELRSHANRGEWEVAIHCCEQLLQAETLNSTAHFYHGLILEQLGKLEEAERALRKAIYIDPQSAVSHYYLGLLLQSQKKQVPAIRAFEHALALLVTRADSDTFREADDITVGDMKRLSERSIETLGRVDES